MRYGRIAALAAVVLGLGTGVAGAQPPAAAGGPPPAKALSVMSATFATTDLQSQYVTTAPKPSHATTITAAAA